MVKKIEELIKSGWECQSIEGYKEWNSRVENFLCVAMDGSYAEEFSNRMDYYEDDDIFGEYSKLTGLNAQIGYLEGLVTRENNTKTKPIYKEKNIKRTNEVFIVHGHDREIKETVARYMGKLELNPIILHEQPSGGKTIIEKFEKFSNVGFAIVLLTPDDVIHLKNNNDKPESRARQNVIMELGYFLGKLGRHRVCALYKSGVEIPSDYTGVMYIEIDTAGAWKINLAQELVEANFSINSEAIIGK